MNLHGHLHLQRNDAWSSRRALLGAPGTHPDGFVVNCPSPVLAPNTYDPAQFQAAATPAG